jgi:large conductance mechanosensitive channel
MSLVKEFKEFALKGNVVDMAVGIIIGAAFGKIVASLVGDVVMPPLGAMMGHEDFSSFVVPGNIRLGAFLNTVIDFLIVAVAIFIVVKLMNMVRHQAPPAPPAPTKQELLLTEIRDLLKARG